MMIASWGASGIHATLYDSPVSKMYLGSSNTVQIKEILEEFLGDCRIIVTKIIGGVFMGEDFKLPASSYDELVKIIQAYGRVSEPSSNDEINKLCLIHPSTISRNGAFLLATGIIEGGQKKIATDKGKLLARAIQFDNETEVSRLWREISNENDFLSKMISAIKIRKGMDIQSFQSHIAYSSGQDKTQYVKTGSATVIEILKISNLIEDLDGKLIAKNLENLGNEQPSLQSAPSVTEINVGNQKMKKTFSTRQGAVAVNIEIRVNVTTDFEQLDELGTKIRKVLADLNEEIQNDLTVE